MKKISLDFETYSECDIKKAGAWAYAKHKSTRVICMAYAEGDSKPNIWLPKDRYPDFLKNPDKYEIHAWNSFFEWVIWTHVLKLPTPPISQWHDTAGLASAMALPRALGSCAIALGMPENKMKDKRGYYLINKLSKPNKLNGDLQLLEEMYQYCIQDVITEQAIAKKLYKLNPLERKIWELDQTINIRGIKVDRPTIKDAIYLYEQQQNILQNKLIDIKGLDNPNSQKQFLGWLLDRGVMVDNVQKSTLQNLLSRPDQFNVHEAVKLKLSLAKTAPKKYMAMKEKIGSGTRLHGNIMYHGASTGRWVSTGVNLQNIARPTLDPDECIDLIKTRNIGKLTESFDPMEALSSSIRGMLVPTMGKKFVVGDYASIEARALAWLAGQKDKLELFRGDGKIYEDAASKIYKKPIADITKNERFIGKISELACGYGGGAKAFKVMAKNYGVDIPHREAEKIKQQWRANNTFITQFWYDIEQCAREAVQRKGVHKVNRIQFGKTNNFLQCKLPSGRILYYYRPIIKDKEILMFKTPAVDDEPEMTYLYSPVEYPSKKAFYDHAYKNGVEPYTFTAMTIEFWGTNSTTKKFCKMNTYGGKLVENITQAVARDIMANSMLILEEAGYEIVLTVHDEIISESENGNKDEFKTLMEKTPDWATNLPITVEAYEAMRYRK